ncbi:MAG TPA: selenide, water dikinase SelD [Thermoanaerobaculia bacterium]|jgi:selenide,water dikinase|nr:selenide, water dikinase SelD [Thermoanaerobaculia bacterium]
MTSRAAGYPALSTFASSAGCACKIGQFDLSALLGRLPVQEDPNLLVGNAESDDAAVYRMGGGQAIVQTVDFFTPVVDDPRLFGRIAATNALSDIYAMRGRPVLALALVAFPMKVLPGEVLEDILRGGAEKVAEAGAVIGGGHSIDHDIPLYGLSVTGVVEETKVTRNAGARPGDALVLTKPLGMGVTIRAGRVDSAAAAGEGGPRKLSDAALEEAVAVMCTLNRAPVEAMDGFDIHAVTDVTGFGLLGHAHEMMAASGTTAEFSMDRVPLLSQARRLVVEGVAPGGSKTNARNMRTRAEVAEGVSEEDFLLVCDAQTSGGLLVALPQAQAGRYAARCRETGAPSAAVVGRVLERGPALLRLTR